MISPDLTRFAVAASPVALYRIRSGKGRAERVGGWARGGWANAPPSYSLFGDAECAAVMQSSGDALLVAYFTASWWVAVLCRTECLIFPHF